MAENFPHIVLSQTGRSIKYTSAGGGGGTKFDSPPRPARIPHGESILNGLAKAQEQAERDLATQPIGAGLQFIPMEFEKHQDFPMMLEQLDGQRLGVRIVNARTVGDRTRFTVAMPKSSVTKFADKIKAYMTRDTAKGKPMNENFAIGIASVNPVHLPQRESCFKHRRSCTILECNHRWCIHRSCLG